METYGGVVHVGNKKVSWLKAILDFGLYALRYSSPDKMLSSFMSSKKEKKTDQDQTVEEEAEEEETISHTEEEHYVEQQQTLSPRIENDNNNNDDDGVEIQQEQQEVVGTTTIIPIVENSDNIEENVEQNAENKEDEEEEEDLGETLFNLYIDEDYQLYHFEWNSVVSFDLYHLNTSSTQYDMTGQVIWPASEVLARYLIDHRDILQLNRKKCLEFGAGVGLSGFAAAFAGCATTVLTDDSQNRIVERLLIKNVELLREQVIEQTRNNGQLRRSNNGEENNPIVAYAPLHWGDATDLKHITETYGTFDILIGADTVYWPDSVVPLLTSIDVLLSHEPDALCFLVYVERSHKTCNHLLDAARDQFNFQVEYLPDEEVDHKYNLNHLTGEKVKTITIKRKHHE